MILLTLAYKGTAFSGFGVQPGKRTVQGAIQDAIEQIYGERYPVIGCSRTDAGVHARDYKLTFTPGPSAPHIVCSRIPGALNAVLGTDIAVLSAEEVSASFHVRHDVYEKEYEYLLYDTPVRSPFYTDTAFHSHHAVNAALLHEAAKAFLGTHDFRGFMASGSDILDTVRTVRAVSVFREGGLVHIRISADGFLYNMVRIFVGTLLSVNEGKITPDALPRIIASCDRSRAGMTVPAHGLYLNRVSFMKTDGREGENP